MDNYIEVVKMALLDSRCSICVMDHSVDYFDLEFSRDITEIIETCEVIDAPVLYFYTTIDNNLGVTLLGSMSVLVGYGDESICDYNVNKYMEDLVDGI